MMKAIDRRQFLAIGASSPLLAASLRPMQFAYVGAASGISVFSIDSSDQWKLLQNVPSRSPAFLLLNRQQTLLFAANAIDTHHGCQRGTVEAYAIDEHSGSLSLVSRQPLSLSALRPRHMALSQDEQHLVVTAFGGGAYNVLPVTRGGGLDAPVHIVKEVGRSQHPEWQTSAHPHSLAWHPNGEYLLTSDFGRDALNVFAMNAGGLERCSRRAVPPGDGPGAIAFAGDRIVILNALARSLSLREFVSRAGTIGAEVGRTALPSVRLPHGPAAMVSGNSPKCVYTAADGFLTVWGAQSGSRIRPLQSVRIGVVADHGLAVFSRGEQLLISDRTNGLVRTFNVDANSGTLTDRNVVAARVAEPLSVAIKA